MKIVCQPNDAAEAIGAASRVINAHTTVPVLTHVLVTANGDGCAHVRATDLQVTLERSFPCDVQESGFVAVPGRLFAEYLSRLSDGNLEIEASPRRMDVKIGGNASTFHVMQGDDYPGATMYKPQWTLTVPGEAFRAALRAVRFAASADEVRGQVLMSVLFEFADGVLTLCATDGYRFARYQSTIACGDISGRYMVPSWMFKTILENLGDAEAIDIAVLGEGAQQMAFSAGETRVTVRLVDGTYPNYKQLMDVKPECFANVERVALLSALARVVCLAGGYNSIVKVEVEPVALNVLASYDCHGSASESIEVLHEGQPLKTAFNGQYLKQILESIDADRVTLEITSMYAPVIIRPTSAEDGVQQVYLLMPVRAYDR